jgi:hypothetical protein
VTFLGLPVWAYIAAFGFFCLVALFVMSLCRIAKDGDEWLREHRAWKQIEELEGKFNAPPRLRRIK